MSTGSPSKDQRAAAKAQKPCCLWLTGLSRPGKSTVANALEMRLQTMGAHAPFSMVHRAPESIIALFGSACDPGRWPAPRRASRRIASDTASHALFSNVRTIKPDRRVSGSDRDPGPWPAPAEGQAAERGRTGP
jgi:hypothetical protein